MQKVSITPNLEINSSRECLLLIAGPCQLESYDHSCMIIKEIKNSLKNLPFSFVFKSSFDKANRSSLNSQRGLGIEEGLRIFEKLKNEFNVPVLSDIHSPDQAKSAAEVVDVLQIPAFLCRQTDLLVAAGNTNRAINVKKGQFLHPADMKFCAEKILKTGNSNIMLCERGTCFGYRDLIVDMRSLMMMREIGYPVIFDATHSVQSMGGSSGTSGGFRQFIPGLARAAVAVGIDGIFIEVHEEPSRAPSDSASMLNLAELPELLKSLAKIHSAI